MRDEYASDLAALAIDPRANKHIDRLCRERSLWRSAAH